MIPLNSLRIEKTTFNSIYIVEDRNLWDLCVDGCNKETDLVLCVDFALKHQLQQQGYCVAFLDHLVSNDVLEPLNFKLHDFLHTWFKDKNGQDILRYKDYNIGDSLLLHLVNDVTYFCHFFFNILEIKNLKYEKIIIAVNDSLIIDCFKKAELSCQVVQHVANADQVVYLFPIAKWLKEKIQHQPLSLRLKNSLANIFDALHRVMDSLSDKKKKCVYMQKYYPTDTVIEVLSLIPSVQLVLQNYTGIKNILKERRIHYLQKKVNKNLLQQLFDQYKNNRCQTWNVESYPIGDYVYELIDVVVTQQLQDAIQKAASIDAHFRSQQLDLMVPITNYWTANRLLMNYCSNHHIPVFLIINGLLNFSYIQDAKDADYVNCYSLSIKKCYFNNSAYALPLGDPRMDKYAQLPPKSINRDNPLIIIGAAGYDSIDLNSYLAYEFDFLYDVLYSIRILRNEGYQANMILKVRGNGYAHLYESFTKEYFADLNIKVVQDQSFFETIREADLYITFYSQTVFEASCLGIPVIYYKKDTQQVHQPFDGKSELVTAFNIEEMKVKLKAFYDNDLMFSEFLKKEVMEQYIGPLDGNNTQRNVDFIHSLIQKK